MVSEALHGMLLVALKEGGVALSRRYHLLSKLRLGNVDGGR